MLAASILSPQFIAGVIIVIVILCIIGSCIRIVPQAHAVIVERLGGYLTTWSVGVHIKMPFVDHVARNVILKEQVCLLYTSKRCLNCYCIRRQLQEDPICCRSLQILIHL